MKSSFIVNPNSGGGKGLRLWNAARNYMTKRGYDYEIFFTAAPGDAAFIAKEITEELTEDEEAPDIFVIGGDGTFNEVLNGLNHVSKVHVVYIPTSPSRGCARSLGLYRSPKRIIKNFNSSAGIGRIEAMDYGVLSCENGEITRRFAGSSGIGMDASVYNNLSRKHYSGTIPGTFFRKLSVAGIGLKEIIFSKPVKGYIVLDDGRRVEFNNLRMISVHIHPYEGGFRFGNYADPKDGMLEVCAVNCKNRFKLIPLMFKSRFKGMRSSSMVRTFQSQEVHIHFDRACAVHTDGECIAPQTDISLRCVRQQFNIFR